MATYQMLWDCTRCGTDKLLGLDHRFCPACGAPQDPERRYYPDQADKVAVEDHRYSGADRSCPACDTANATLAEHCGACGSPMDGAKVVIARSDQLSDTAGQFDTDDAEEARKQHRQAHLDAETQRKAALAGEDPGQTGGSGRAMAAAGLGSLAMMAVGFVMLALCCGFLFWSRTTTFEVTGHSWKRTVEVQAEQMVKKEAWKKDLPRGATDVRCSKKKKSDTKVKDGETCRTRRVDNGDGTYTEKEECTPTYRSDPVYEEHCSYRVEEWTTVRTEKASGHSTKPSPSWPKVRLKRGEKEGRKTETYTVKLSEGRGEANSCTTTEKKWAAMQKGRRYSGKVGVLSGSVDCESLTPTR